MSLCKLVLLILVKWLVCEIKYNIVRIGLTCYRNYRNHNLNLLTTKSMSLTSWGGTFFRGTLCKLHKHIKKDKKTDK